MGHWNSDLRLYSSDENGSYNLPQTAAKQEAVEEVVHFTFVAGHFSIAGSSEQTEYSEGRIPGKGNAPVDRGDWRNPRCRRCRSRARR
ncbi:unnamed protein product [Urochloa humidicola]